jgi:aminomethyltransferase
MATTAPREGKRTPLYDVHRQLGARLIQFGGWEMPVSYSSIVAEHQRVRTHAGLFDVSHMGEFEISGQQAEAAVQHLTPNDVRSLDNYQLQYSALCNDEGGIIDDLTVCRLAPDRFLLIVNAANIDKDFHWVQSHLLPGATVENISDATALLALQGPAAEAILQSLTPVDLQPLRYYHAFEAMVAGHAVLLSRTGYTGEDGFEIMLDAGHAVTVWQAIMHAGHTHGLLPVGLGARDTLRLEARYLLYGVDMDETTNPFEVGLGWITKLDKGAFIGREALQRLKTVGPQRRLVGFVMQERGIPRSHYRVLHDGQPIGTVTSGTMSPSLQQAIGTALVAATHARVGQEWHVEIRDQAVRARVVPAPFVPRRVKR